MPRPRVDCVDLVALRGRPAEVRWQAAQRIFRCWQPLFPHLADKDPTFHLRKHVDDPRPVLLRAYFLVDQDGADRSLAITRIHREVVDGHPVGILTVHAGFRRPDRTRDLGHVYVRDAIVFLLRHPGTSLYFAELVTHPAVYVTCRRMFSGLTPGAQEALDPSMAPLVQLVAEVHGATPVPGGGGLCRTTMQSAFAPDEASRWRERASTNPDLAWFLDRVGPGMAQVVAAPLSPEHLARSAGRVARHKLRRHEEARHART